MTDFVQNWPAIAAFISVSLILTITPGPDMVYFLSHTLRGGRKSGLIALLGTAVGLLCHSILAAVGLSAILAASASAFNLVKIAGALWLLWMAMQMLRKGSKLVLESDETSAVSSTRIFSQGLLINLLNPKILLFFLTFLPQFVTPGDPAVSQKLLMLGLAFIFFGGFGSALIIIGADKIVGRLRHNPKILRGIDYLFAGIMSAFALRLLTARN